MISNEVLSERVLDFIQSKDEPEWMIRSRVEAWKEFERLPMPTKRDEDWRYTDLGNLDLNKFSLGNGLVLNHRIKNEFRKERIVFMDMNNALIDYPDVFKKYFMTQCFIPEENKFVAFNAALWNSGTFLYVPEGVEIDKPLYSSMFATSGSSIFTHNLVVLEEGAKINYIEEYLSRYRESNVLCNDITEIILNDSSKLNLVSLQSWGLNVLNFSTKRAILNKNNSLNIIFGSLGGKLSRLDVDTVFKGKNSTSKNLGLFFGVRDQHIDILTNAVHLAPHTSYDIITRGALKDNATSFYKGLIKIKKEAPETNSMLTDNTLILGKNAYSTSIPSLEIENSNVQAGHAASSGEIDEEQLFYLMSRGLKREIAEMLVVEGFFEPIIKSINFENIRGRFQKIIRGRLGYYG